MNQAVAVESADPSPTPPVHEPALPGIRARLALAVVPLLSLGVFGFVPSLVLALRRGTRGDWLAAVVFTALSVAWSFQIALTPEETHGAQYALDVLLLLGASVAAAVHCLVVRPARTRAVPAQAALTEAAPAGTAPVAPVAHVEATSLEKPAEAAPAEAAPAPTAPSFTKSDDTKTDDTKTDDTKTAGPNA
ncbi:hypothetical protein GPZ77_13855 [Streptomyces sp. QHH-9511]|uniref:hypothetical protein n=1 Tax=Streptomyces sp. QHH-9511 TaxID=2684468 RepID=UPI001319624D|nr:hypothetical protein [Streptomyces sp. QHH-9511]QGZ49314.1 hypothetical protein GPZ77_13855 [Streptomyces sp. QHH-9511]